MDKVIILAENISTDPKSHGDNYKRDYYWTTGPQKRENEKGNTKTPFWDRDQIGGDDTGESYNRSTSFGDSDKSISGPLP